MTPDLNIINGLIAAAVIAVLLFIGLPKLKRKVEVDLEPEVLRQATLTSYHAYQAAVTRLANEAALARADADAAGAQLAQLQKTLGIAPAAVAPAASA